MVQELKKENFIGNVENYGGTYRSTICKELSKKQGRPPYSKTLYRFESRFKRIYYITDTQVVNKLEAMIENEETSKIHDYLYALVIEHFGFPMFLADVEKELEAERKIGFQEGKNHIQKEMRNLLGM